MATEKSQAAPYVFLSYASADRERALRVADLLDAQGVAVWIDRKSIAGGTSWSAEIVRGIRECAVLIVACTPAAAVSPNVQQEIQLAWETRRPILPLLLQAVELPDSIRYALAGRQWIEVLDHPEETWLRPALQALATAGIPARQPPPVVEAPSTGPTPPSGPPIEAPRRTNLPVQVTTFVGRERELTEVKERLAETHLLTLTGSGGCGKTRLALRVAAEVADDYPDGAWLVELAPLSDPTLVLFTIANVLEVRENASVPLLTTLTTFLSRRRILLLLDNCEHLIAASAEVAEAITRACPEVRILATSRELLGVPGELPWRVPPLAVPDAAKLAAAEDIVGVVSQSEAVRLFVDRAVVVAPRFAVSGLNARALAQICQRLDGIPLAIELAAARVAVLSVEQIAGRLDQRFRLLTGGSRTALRRQQTLQAATDWSFDLLAGDERVVLQRLSVFVGGCGLEAAEAVCGSGGLAPEDVLDLVSRLVAKSLVQADDSGREVRYRLLETVRRYASEKLVSASEAEGARDRHRDWCLALAERAELHLISADQAEWLDVLATERDNLRAALTWCWANGDIDEGLQLAAALSRYWYVRWSAHLEGHEWMGRFLSRIDARTPATVRAKALSGALVLALTEQERLAIWDELQAVCEQTGDRATLARNHYWIGRCALWSGDYPSARELFTEGVALTREVGDEWALAQELEGLGWVAQDEGNHAEARPLFEESLRHFRAVQDRRAIAWSLIMAGKTMYLQGEYGAARSSLEEALTISRQLRADRYLSSALIDFGIVARNEGDDRGARELLEESLGLARQADDPQRIALSLSNLAEVARQTGDHNRARALLREALTVIRQAPGLSPRNLTEVIHLPGLLAVDEGRYEPGVRMFGLADANGLGLAVVAPDVRRAYEEMVAQARAALGQAAFAEAWAAGQAMTLEQAIADALGENGGRDSARILE